MPDTASKIRDDFRDFLLRMADAFVRFPELRTEEEELRRLASSIYEPFTLAVFGYMKTGKSSLINTLVGKPLAITGTDETTATLNWISHGTQEQENTFLVNWNDGTSAPFPRDRLKDWTGKGEDALALCARTARIDLYANTEQLKEIRIVDTPGTGSVAAEHSKAASEILSDEEGRKADALLYVFPAVAKALDAEALEEFRNTRLPGSDPYNSIGVLHKWDGLESENPYAEALRKAEVLYEGIKDVKGLKDVVCDIIPVSAPLGMVARHAPDDYLQALIALTTGAESQDHLPKALKMDRRWDADEQRRTVRESYPHIPWVSFVRIVRLLMEHQCQSVAQARRVCLEASGIPLLESELNRRFFRATAVIKQRLARAKAKPLLDRGILALNQRHDTLVADLDHFTDLLRITPKDSQHHRWLNSKVTSMNREIRDFDEFAVETHRLILIETERMNRMEMDISFLDAINKQPGFVELEDEDRIRQILGDGNASNDSTPITPEDLKTMIGRYQHQLHGPIKRIKLLFEHLIRRIQELLREA